jgi:hypothetical protein
MIKEAQIELRMECGSEPDRGLFVTTRNQENRLKYNIRIHIELMTLEASSYDYLVSNWIANVSLTLPVFKRVGILYVRSPFLNVLTVALSG